MGKKRPTLPGDGDVACDGDGAIVDIVVVDIVV